MAGISISGLASGLDVDALIDTLMKVEEAPRVRIERRQGQAKAREDALREIRTRLQNVADAAGALRATKLWSDVQSVESSAPNGVAAKRLSGAGPGGYQVEVTQLARAEQRTYDFSASAGASQITINGATVQLGANADLAAAVAAINANDQTGVYAVDVGGRLVLASRETGAAATISAGGATIAEDGSRLKAGLDALFSVDGEARSSASNLVADAIPGLELTLKSATPGPATITVGNPGADAEAVEVAVEAFVDAYNAAVDSIRSRLTEERLPKAATQAEANRGVLFGDTQLNGLLSGMRRLVTESGLDQLGVGSGGPSAQVDPGSGRVIGRLVLDEAKLSAALAADPAAVRNRLAGAGGFVESLDELLGPTLGTGGAIAGRMEAAAAESKRLSESMSRLSLRLDRREERLRAQFAALETMLTRSQSESQWLNGQLASLYG